MSTRRFKIIDGEEKLKSGLMTPPDSDIHSKTYKEAESIFRDRIQQLSPLDKMQIEITGLEVMMRQYLQSRVRAPQEIRSVHSFYQELLEKTEIPQVKLAGYIDMKPNNLYMMFRDSKVNYKVANVFEEIFNIESTLWLDIQEKNSAIAQSDTPKKTYKKRSLKGLYAYKKR